jgi:phosphatidate cytidylyltransferase
MRTRVVWGATLAIVALAFATVGGWPMTIAVAVLAALVGREWAAITIGARVDAMVALAAIAAIAVILTGASQIMAALIATGVAALAAGIWLRSGWAASGVIYAALLGTALVALRGDASFGLKALLFVLAVVWATDTAAYFVGRAIGGPKLWPAVSPGKTWSGAVGGALVGSAVGVATAIAAGAPATVALAGIALGLSVVSQLGDLFESAVKRRFGVKDASHLIPGHGGIMDRVDALAFAAVAAALVGWFNAGWPNLGSGVLLW